MQTKDCLTCGAPLKPDNNPSTSGMFCGLDCKHGYTPPIYVHYRGIDWTVAPTHKGSDVFGLHAIGVQKSAVPCFGRMIIAGRIASGEMRAIA